MKVEDMGLRSKEYRARRILYLTYPLISLLTTLIVLVIISILSYLKYGVLNIALQHIHPILTIILLILSVLGMIDGLFLDSQIGFSFAKYLRLLDRKLLNDLRYVTDVKGVIGKGAKTIQIALALINLLTYIFI